MIRDDKGEHYTNSGRLDYRTKSFGEVDTHCLMEAFSNESGFIMLNRSIRIFLSLKTHVPYQFLIFGRRNK